MELEKLQQLIVWQALPQWLVEMVNSLSLFILLKLSQEEYNIWVCLVNSIDLWTFNPKLSWHVKHSKNYWSLSPGDLSLSLSLSLRACAFQVCFMFSVIYELTYFRIEMAQKRSAWPFLEFCIFCSLISFGMHCLVKSTSTSLLPLKAYPVLLSNRYVCKHRGVIQPLSS